ncbi:hypothetical protein BASA83_001898 [Batrachochytrium salamandrivorans]|nr:hypothetical protein BASA83_001898 [Batrachochytrium salamandrivorans]
MPDVNDSDCTLFIRNLSFDTTEEELNTAFSTFGKLRYARVTLDKTSKLSRAIRVLPLETLPQRKVCCKLNSIVLFHSTKSIITAELSQMASSGSSAFHWRTHAQCHFSSIQENWLELTHDSKLRRRSQDKRHMYLMREGVIFAGSEAAKTLSEAELLKRTELC